MREEKCLKIRYLNCWISYHHSQLSKRRLLSQSNNHYRFVQIKKYYYSWKKLSEEKKEERRITSLALYHWSHSLKSQVLREWRQYTCKKRRERVKFIEAVLLRNHLLQREGLRAILSYADTITQVTRTCELLNLFFHVNIIKKQKRLTFR